MARTSALSRLVVAALFAAGLYSIASSLFLLVALHGYLPAPEPPSAPLDDPSTAGISSFARKRHAADNASNSGASAPTAAARARNISVVSYSLYGNRSRYVLSALVIAESFVPSVYPGWQIRIYHDASVPPPVLNQLRRLPHVRLVDVKSDLGASEWSDWLSRANPMVWRFLVASDPDVDVYVVRDIDSLPTPRERAAVDEWLASGRPFHVMHDHPRHYFWSGRNVTIPGGMWGGLGGRAIPDMRDLLWERYHGNKRFGKGDDQDFLYESVWPRVEALGPEGSVRHNSFDCLENGGVAFPTAGEWDLDGYDFVGDVIQWVSGGSNNTLGGLRMLSRSEEGSGTCWMKDLVRKGTHERNLYRKCLQRRKEEGYGSSNSTPEKLQNESHSPPQPPPPRCKKKPKPAMTWRKKKVQK